MRCLIQRVQNASVRVNDQVVGEIGPGLLVFAGLERDDAGASIQRMVERVLGYRVFSDENGRMNRSVVDHQGGLLVISQFTLAADTRKGMRPSFSSAAVPDQARRLFDDFVASLKARHSPVSQGVFGADMQVSLINDGPVTFLLET